MKKNNLYRVTRDCEFLYWQGGEIPFTAIIYPREGLPVLTTDICKLIDIMKIGKNERHYRFYIIDKHVTITIMDSVRFFELIPINYNKIWNNLNV